MNTEYKIEKMLLIKSSLVTELEMMSEEYKDVQNQLAHTEQQITELIKKLGKERLDSYKNSFTGVK